MLEYSVTIEIYWDIQMPGLGYQDIPLMKFRFDNVMWTIIIPMKKFGIKRKIMIETYLKLEYI